MSVFNKELLTYLDGEKSSISTNRKLTTRSPTMNRVRYPQVPQRMAQNAILLFLPVKFNFCRKTSATKFLCMETSTAKL